MSFVTQKRLLEHKGKLHVSGFPKQPISNNININKTQAGSDDHPPDNHRGNLQQQEYKKKKEQEDIIKLLVEEELGMKLTIRSYIENMVLDEAWNKIQNKSPPPQQQQQPPPQDHICCQGQRVASKDLPTSPHSPTF